MKRTLEAKQLRSRRETKKKKNTASSKKFHVETKPDRTEISDKNEAVLVKTFFPKTPIITFVVSS